MDDLILEILLKRLMKPIHTYACRPLAMLNSIAKIVEDVVQYFAMSRV